jgi:hypothetical protein
VKREKISPEEYRARLDQAVNAKRGRWRTLPRAIASSRAFAELSKSGLIVVLAMLDNLTYQGKSKKGRNGLQCCDLPLDNNGEFVITNNELIARGLKSPESIARGRKEAWEVGFYDVVKTGTLMNYGVYRYSERWKKFPNGEYLPQDERSPGKCLYPREKKARSEPTSENVVTTTSENVVKGGGSVTTENVVIETGSPTTDSVVNIIMYQAHKAGVQVQEKNQREEQDRELSPIILCSETPEDNQNLITEDPITSVIRTVEPVPLQHRWFLDAFHSACQERGVEADLTLGPSLASTLDNWLEERLRRGRYHGRTFFYDENISNIKDKLNQIVSKWEFMRIPTPFGQPIEVPPVPDLTFLITNREMLFRWACEQRQNNLEEDLIQFGVMEQSALVEYTH